MWTYSAPSVAGKSFAIYHAVQLARERDPADALVVNLSGRGDKDMTTIAERIGVSL